MRGGERREDEKNGEERQDDEGKDIEVKETGNESR